MENERANSSLMMFWSLAQKKKTGQSEEKLLCQGSKQFQKYLNYFLYIHSRNVFTFSYKNSAVCASFVPIYTLNKEALIMHEEASLDFLSPFSEGEVIF